MHRIIPPTYINHFKSLDSSISICITVLTMSPVPQQLPCYDLQKSLHDFISVHEMLCDLPQSFKSSIYLCDILSKSHFQLQLCPCPDLWWPCDLWCLFWWAHSSDNSYELDKDDESLPHDDSDDEVEYDDKDKSFATTFSVKSLRFW